MLNEWSIIEEYGVNPIELLELMLLMMGSDTNGEQDEMILAFIADNVPEFQMDEAYDKMVEHGSPVADLLIRG